MKNESSTELLALIMHVRIHRPLQRTSSMGGDLVTGGT